MFGEREKLIIIERRVISAQKGAADLLKMLPYVRVG